MLTRRGGVMRRCIGVVGLACWLLPAGSNTALVTLTLMLLLAGAIQVR